MPEIGDCFLLWHTSPDGRIRATRSAWKSITSLHDPEPHKPEKVIWTDKLLWVVLDSPPL